MKKIFLFSAFISIFLMNAQTTPTIEWQKSLGGSSYDFANSVQQTSDGGYIIAGETQSNNSGGFSDYWVVKLDNGGAIQWQKSLGGSGDDIANSIQQTTDGGYIIAGYSNSDDGNVSGNHGSLDYWIVKLGSSGALQWQKSFGGSHNDAATSIQQTTDGGYIVAGFTYSNDGDVNGNHGNYDYWILKLDSNGTLQWQKSLGGSGYDEATSIQQTIDGGYIVSGSSYSNDGDVNGNHGNRDYWIVKLDNGGNIQWQKSLGGSSYDEATSIQQTTDGGYIVAGSSYSNDGDVNGNHGDFDYWIVKLDNGGNIQWQKSLGGSGDDGIASIQQTTDGGYIIAGHSNSNNGDVDENHGNYDYWIVKLSSSSALQWQKSFGGTDSDYPQSVKQTADSGYIIAGVSYSNNGDVSGNHGESDYWIVKLSAEGLATQELQNTKINIYPNPVKDVLNFSEEVPHIRITDISGRTIKEISVKGNSVNVSNLSKGIYIVTATTKNGEISRKIVKE